MSSPRDTQYAAIAWRRSPDLEILLITSRETKRWVVPKGWPMAGISPPHCAAREAYEEAGVRGEISMASAGRFPYLKRMRSGNIREVMIEAYALKVTEQAETWPEKGQRECRWFPAEEAASLVAEEGLASLIRRFARSQL